MMITQVRRLAVLALILTSSAGAQGLNGASTGLVSPNRVITFNGFTGVVPALNQFIAQGVTFSSGLTINDWSYFGGTGGGLGSLDNFSGGQGPTPSFSIYFSHAVRGAAFQFITNPNTVTSMFTAVLNGVDVYSYSVPTSSNGVATPEFYGFDSSIAFDEIRFLPEQQYNHAMVLDNLQIGDDYVAEVAADNVTAAPEPGSIVLLATGFVGIAGVTRRRRKS